MNKERCHACNIAAGAQCPDGSMIVTVYQGVCDDCHETTTIVPASDYNWPLEGKKAVWD